MRKYLILFLSLHAAVTAGIPVREAYYGPTEQLVKREGWETIEKELQKIKIPDDLIPFFDAIADEESWGHIGYHGATQDYRIYQDIIRFTVEEVLGIPVREDFHFLRVPGDTKLNLENIEAFSRYWHGDMDNKTKTRKKQLLALNYGIYSNFENKGSCSIRLFVKDTSKTDIDYRKHLEPFYKKLGLSTGTLKKLFKIAHNRLKGDRGILLRLSENSHLEDPEKQAYNFADEQCYPCKRSGYRAGTRLISDEYACIMSEEYVRHEDHIAPQLRILINNQYTLNPYSHLSIQRWDDYDQNTIRFYEKEMREYIKNLEADPSKVEKYREELLQAWTF